MKTLKQLFNKLLPKRTPDLKPGEVYVLKPRNGDPFPQNTSGVTVVEVKAGWVLYKIGSGSMFPSERLSIENFNYIYTPSTYENT